MATGTEHRTGGHVSPGWHATWHWMLAVSPFEPHTAVRRKGEWFPWVHAEGLPGTPKRLHLLPAVCHMHQHGMSSGTHAAGSRRICPHTLLHLIS